MDPRGSMLVRPPFTWKPLGYQMLGRVSQACLMDWLLWAQRGLPKLKE